MKALYALFAALALCVPALAEEEKQTMQIVIGDRHYEIRLERNETAQAIAAALPLSYEYENAAGQRFLVFAFESLFASQSWMRCYLRAEQVRDFARRAGDGLPAFCPGHPELYLLAKRSGPYLAVGLWNLFPDAIAAPRIETDAPVRAVNGLCCSASYDGCAVTLSGIPAFGFAFFEAALEPPQA